MRIKDIIVEGYTVLPWPPIDKEKYQSRSGLEGPFLLRNGKVVYYDPKQGQYYDPNTDMYIDYDDYKKMDEQGVAEGLADAIKNREAQRQRLIKKAAADLKAGRGTVDQLIKKYDLFAGDKAAIQSLSEGSPQSMGTALANSLMRAEPGSKLDKKIRQHNDMVRRFGVEYGTMTSAPDGYRINKKGFIVLGEDNGVHENVAHTVKKAVKSFKRGIRGWEKGMHDVESVRAATKTLSAAQKDEILRSNPPKGSPAEFQKKLIQRELKNQTETVDQRPHYVVKATDKPKKIKPTTGGESPHPYQGKLVGEDSAARNRNRKMAQATDYEQRAKATRSPIKAAHFRKMADDIRSSILQDESPHADVKTQEAADVGTTGYQWAHGKKPSGQGSWFFTSHRRGVDFARDQEGKDYIQLNMMTYSDAKRAARAWAKQQGHTQIFVAESTQHHNESKAEVATWGTSKVIYAHTPNQAHSFMLSKNNQNDLAKLTDGDYSEIIDELGERLTVSRKNQQFTFSTADGKASATVAASDIITL